MHGNMWFAYQISSYTETVKNRTRVTVCIHHRANPDQPSCGMRGGMEVAEALRLAIDERGLETAVDTFNCLGKCELGPNAKLSPGGEFYHRLAPTELDSLLEKIAAFAVRRKAPAPS